MSNPAFVLIATNPFGLSDVRAYAAPTLVDIDADGDLDALIGNLYGDTLFFENTGSANSPAFATAITNPFGLSNIGSIARPTFVDIDSDGDLDALIGNDDGDTLFFENTGSASSPTFATAITNPFGLNDVGWRATPNFIDIDADGDLDALIGNYYGNTLFFENTGSANSPAFATAITNPFGLSDVGVFGNASPAFADIDSDGDLDALIGNDDGDTLFFENTGSASSPAFAPAITNPFGLSDVRWGANPTLVDIDGDGDLDALIGNDYGDTLFFFNGPWVLITENDDDTTVTEGGATDTYTIALNTPPTSKVTITLDNTNQQVISDVSTLIFTPTNWNVAQTVTITAVDDTAVEGNHHSLVKHTVSSKDTNYNNLVVDPVTIAIIDNDSLTNEPIFTFSSTNPFGLSDIERSAVPNFVDIDGDGDLDAFVGNGYDYYNGGGGDTFFFENEGTESEPVFTYVATNPFGLSNVGYAASPTFVDIDGDGDLDALIGGSYSGDTLFFENTGTTSNPVFAAPIRNPFGLSKVGYAASPTFVDIDDDGDLDALIGNDDGDTLFFENTGSTSSPAFAPASTNPFGLSDVGRIASPTFVDIDGDGDLDALIGNDDGDMLFFKNTGSANSPAFATAITNPFGLSDVGIWASPALVDIDADGDLDALIGNGYGDTLFFLNATSGNVLFSTTGDDILNGTSSDNDTVSYINAPAPVTVSLLIDTQQNTIGHGFDTLIDIENLVGSDFNDDLRGDAEDNTLSGEAGNDVLRGWSGADTMIGGPGNDRYFVENLGDVVIEQSNQGTDHVTSKINYTLPANVENLTLKGSTSAINGTGNDLANNITGNAADNQINGRDGDDTLNGKAGNDTLRGWSGADTMIGGPGNDNYFVENLGDVVIEQSNQGTDHVSSKITYTLPANVENLTLKSGSLVIHGTGNDLNNKLIGNSANNQLNGGDGNDRLDGKGGADTLVGGLGNDIYVVDNAGDIVIENASEGRDKINSKVTYTLPDNVEKLTLTGSSAIDGTGNSKGNTLTGNSAANQLDGGAGIDKLDGKGGNNILTGGAGKDTFKFTTSGHIDTITDFDVPKDTIQLDNAVFTALTSTGTLAADQFVIGAAALDANDFVIYDDTAGSLFYDADGSGPGAAIQVAVISSGLAMTNADIVVI